MFLYERLWYAYREGNWPMDAIVGKYRVRMEACGLVLTHPAGICFDLTVDEALGLLDYLQIYRQAVMELQLQDREKRLEHVFQQE